MGWIGPGEIILILILVLVLFGPGKLPEIGRLIGSGMREIRKLSSISLDEIDDEKKETPEIMDLPHEITESLDVVSPEFREEDYASNGDKTGEPHENRKNI